MICLLKKLKIEILFVFVLSATMLALSNANAANIHAQPISLTIDLQKNVFEVGEPIEGTISVRNSYAATIPAGFNIKIFHDGTFVSQSFTTVHIPLGTTKFSFKKFGIPIFNVDPSAQGEWHISIVQRGQNPAPAQEVTLHIMKSGKM